MDDRKLEEDKAKRRGKPISEDKKPKTKKLPYSFEDGQFFFVVGFHSLCQSLNIYFEIYLKDYSSDKFHCTKSLKKKELSTCKKDKIDITH